MKPGFSLAGMRIDIWRRLFARMTSRTTLCENFFSPRHHRCIARDVSLATGRVGEMKWFQATEECCNVPQALFRCAPEDRMFPRIRDFKRLLWSQPNQAVVECQPVFGKHADVDIDADRCASDADRVCAVLQHVRHGHLLLFSGESERAARHF